MHCLKNKAVPHHIQKMATIVRERPNRIPLLSPSTADRARHTSFSLAPPFSSRQHPFRLSVYSHRRRSLSRQGRGYSYLTRFVCYHRNPIRAVVRLWGLMMRVMLLIGFLLLTVGCSQKPGGEAQPSPAQPVPQVQPPPTDEVKIDFPALGAPKRLEPKIDFYEVTLQRAGHPMRVWVYVPEHKPGQKFPCVLIAPAGSPLIIGMGLAEGDRAEHLPYARAGFIVVSYEIDGHLANRNVEDKEFIVAATAFKNAKAGVLNARVALDFAHAKVPEIDPIRIYSAGHSSAATLSLLVASDDQRIKGCAAFAPVTDVEGRIGRTAIVELSGSIPDYEAFMKASSPRSHLGDLKCPVFLFHAKDDTTVPLSETSRFATDLKRTNRLVTFVEVPKGGHYTSMVSEGIPKAIEWFRKLGG
jgi:pimeloyl-ACP methyl ester carboxylesterase